MQISRRFFFVFFPLTISTVWKNFKRKTVFVFFLLSRSQNWTKAGKISYPRFFLLKSKFRLNSVKKATWLQFIVIRAQDILETGFQIRRNKPIVISKSKIVLHFPESHERKKVIRVQVKFCQWWKNRSPFWIRETGLQLDDAFTITMTFYSWYSSLKTNHIYDRL